MDCGVSENEYSYSRFVLRIKGGLGLDEESSGWSGCTRIVFWIGYGGGIHLSYLGWIVGVWEGDALLLRVLSLRLGAYAVQR